MLKLFFIVFSLTLSLSSHTKVQWGSHSQFGPEEKTFLASYLYKQCKKFKSENNNAIVIAESKDIKPGQIEYFIQFYEENLYDIEMLVIKTDSDVFVDFESLTGCI